VESDGGVVPPATVGGVRRQTGEEELGVLTAAPDTRSAVAHAVDPRTRCEHTQHDASVVATTIVFHPLCADKEKSPRGRKLAPPTEAPSPHPVFLPSARGMTHTSGVMPAGGGWSRREERHGAGPSSAGSSSPQQHGGATPVGRTADTGAVSGDSLAAPPGRGSHKGAPCAKCGTPPGNACEAVAHACFTLRAAKGARSGEAGERVVQELVQAGHRCAPWPRGTGLALLRPSTPQPRAPAPDAATPRP
jgi:hypothetical protein